MKSNRGGFNRGGRGGNRKSQESRTEEGTFNKDKLHHKQMNKEGKTYQQKGNQFNRSNDKGKNYQQGGNNNNSNNNKRNNKNHKMNSGHKGGNKSYIEPHHKYEGVFKSSSRTGDYLLTLNYTPGHNVYGEKLQVVDNKEGGQIEYRQWEPLRSKIGASLILGIREFGIKPKSNVLYLGAASGTTISHISDIIGKEGRVYGVEFSPRVGRELANLAKERINIVPIIEDARHPNKYRMIVPMVDYMFADVAQPDQARIFSLNAQYYLRNNGGFMICIKASCVDSTRPAEEIYEEAKNELVENGFKVNEIIDINEYHRGHACIIGIYRPTK